VAAGVAGVVGVGWRESSCDARESDGSADATHD
jgi:hypothetical protein